MPSFLRQRGADVFIAVKVRAGAKQTCIRRVLGDTLCLDVHASPEQGKANALLIRFMADFFGKHLSEVEVHAGTFSHQKTILIKNSTVLDIETKISAALRSPPS